MSVTGYISIALFVTVLASFIVTVFYMFYKEYSQISQRVKELDLEAAALQLILNSKTSHLSVQNFGSNIYSPDSLKCIISSRGVKGTLSKPKLDKEYYV